MNKTDVAKSELTSPEVLKELVKDDSGRYKIYVASNPSAPPELLSDLALDANPSIRYAVAANPNSPQALIEKLALDTSYSVREACVKNPTLSDEVRIKSIFGAITTLNIDPSLAIGLAEQHGLLNALACNLAIDDRPEVRRVLATRKDLPRDVFSTLSKDSDESTRVTVVRNPNTPAAIRERMVTDPSVGVRRQIAGHAHTSVHNLLTLATDTAIEVRYEVGKNPNTDQKTLIRLAFDLEPSVRKAVASNTNTGSFILSRMINDVSGEVRTIAASNPATPLNRRLRFWQSQPPLRIIAGNSDICFACGLVGIERLSCSDVSCPNQRAESGMPPDLTGKISEIIQRYGTSLEELSTYPQPESDMIQDIAAIFGVEVDRNRLIECLEVILEAEISASLYSYSPGIILPEQPIGGLAPSIPKGEVQNALNSDIRGPKARKFDSFQNACIPVAWDFANSLYQYSLGQVRLDEYGILETAAILPDQWVASIKQEVSAREVRELEIYGYVEE